MMTRKQSKACNASAGFWTAMATVLLLAILLPQDCNADWEGGMAQGSSGFVMTLVVLSVVNYCLLLINTQSKKRSLKIISWLLLLPQLVLLLIGMLTGGAAGIMAFLAFVLAIIINALTKVDKHKQ